MSELLTASAAYAPREGWPYRWPWTSSPRYETTLTATWSCSQNAMKDKP